MMHKQRTKANIVDSTLVIGDVEGKDVIIIDDMTDTSGTLCMAATELKKKGAKKVYAFITHGIFSGPAPERIKESELEMVVCSDSIKYPEGVEERMGGKLKKVSLDLLIAEVIRRTHYNENTESLQIEGTYKDDN